MRLPSTSSPSSLRTGLLCGLGAYGLWGVFPLYFAAIPINLLELLAHRITWSAVLLAAVVSLSRRWPEARRAVFTGRVMLILSVTTILIASNWLMFLSAIEHKVVLEASLAYFLTPLLNVLMGVVFLGERLRRPQMAAIALAAIGLAVWAVALGQVSWLAIGLAGTFAFYGLLRKLVAVDGVLALLIETTLLAPLAVVYLLLEHARGVDQFSLAWNHIQPMLIGSGVVTALPLLLFAGATRRLPLTTIGFLQFIAPTLQFLMAVLLLGEPLAPAKLASFAFFWAAVVIYCVDSVMVYRRRHGAPSEPPETIEEFATAYD